jgi:hypothetical protein
VEQVEKFGKRIRLDSTEKNILMESERRESEQEVMESQTEPPSCYAGMSSADHHPVLEWI